MNFTIKRGSLEIPLTSEEIFEIYNSVESGYLRDDAVRHIIEYFDDRDASYGFLNEVVTAEQIREEVIDEYLNIQDCNIPENDTWHNAVYNVMSAHGYDSI